MKLTINKTELAQALTNITAAVSPMTTIPILGNVLMRASADELELVATDLDVTISVKIDATVANEGECTLPAKRLSGLIREMPAQNASLDWDGQRAHIESGASHVRLNGLPASEFPGRAEPGDEVASFSVSAQALAAIIRKTASAASVDESRYVLNGMLIESTGAGLIFIATDGRRLAKVEMPMDGLPPFAAIVPNKTISLLQKTLDVGDCDIAIYGSEVVFRMTGGAEIHSKTIEGSYPNWRQVMPTFTDVNVTVERELLAGAVKRVGLMMDEKANSITFAFSENQITIEGNSPDVGESRETVECQCEVNLTTALNPHYVAQVLSGLRCDSVRMSILDASSLVLFLDEQFQAVIAPMRIA